MGPKQVLPLQVKVDVEVMSVKVYSILSRFPELMPPHQIQLSVTSVVANELDYEIVLNEFEFQSCYYVHIRINALREMFWIPSSL